MTRHPTVLIVDGDRRLCRALEYILEQKSYCVQTASSGKEALEKMKASAFDLFLLDIGLPDSSGIGLMERLLSARTSAQVILRTGRASAGMAVEAMKRGAFDYLRKPFPPEDLDKTINNALKQTQLIEANRAMTKRLTVSERRYRYLIHNSPDVIYTLDAEGRFTFVNKAAETVLGYKARGLIGRMYATLFDPSDLQIARWRFNERRTGFRATSALQLRIKTGPRKHRQRRPGNGRVAVESNATGMYRPQRDEGLRVRLGTYGVVRDVGQRKQLEDRLLQANKMQAVGNPAGGIAHDFNNLLMGIQGNVSLMLMDLTSTDGFYKRLKNIEQHVQNGAEMTRQLRGFVRKRRFEIQTVNINDLIRNQNRLFGGPRKEICHQGRAVPQYLAGRRRSRSN